MAQTKALSIVLNLTSILHNILDILNVSDYDAYIAYGCVRRVGCLETF